MLKPNSKSRFLFSQRAKRHIDIPEKNERVKPVWSLFGVDALQQRVMGTGLMHDHVRQQLLR